MKASSTVTVDDFHGLRKLQEAAGKKFTAGVLLYDGEAVVGFGSRQDPPSMLVKNAE